MRRASAVRELHPDGSAAVLAVQKSFFPSLRARLQSRRLPCREHRVSSTPHLFHKLLALSGRYDLTLSPGPYRDLFDGYYDETIYFNNPSHFLPRLTDPVLLDDLRHMDITLVIGEHDPFLENNHQLHLTLNAQHVPHRYYVWHGEAHRARYWRQMVALYL